jgi:glycosyltransferase involved in cell wall biosynthesis
MNVSVVVCTHSAARWNELACAVHSISAQSYQPVELVIVVDHNPPLLERAQARWPLATIVANASAPGLSGARNTGVAHATGRIVAFLDDDAVAAPDWLERLVESYAQDDVIGVGGRIEPNWVTGRPSWFPGEFDWVVGCTYTGMPLDRAPVRNMIGANMSFRREVLDELTGFRREVGRAGSVPSGCEETEFCIRAGQRWPDRRVLYDPDAVVYHRVPASRGTATYFVARCFAEGRSKAAVSRFVGSGSALSLEASYTLRVLPLALVRGLVDVIWHRDRSGIARTGAILVGLVATASGFVTGRLRLRPAIGWVGRRPEAFPTPSRRWRGQNPH